MAQAADTSPEDFFAESAVGLAVYARVHALLTATFPDLTVRVTASQVAFRRLRGFAYLWLPGQYLRHPTAPVVLSIASPSRIASTRFKEVVHPGTWMHHLEIRSRDDVDEEVAGWLLRAARSAGTPPSDSRLRR